MTSASQADPADPDSEPHERSASDRLLALLLVLPAAAVLWPLPGALPLGVRGQLLPELSGAGLAALAALPAALTLLLRGVVPSSGAPRAPRGLAPLVLFVAAGFLSLELSPPSDTLEASRASLLYGAGLVLFLGAARLGPAGRELLTKLLVALAGLALLPALVDFDGRHAGVLGNTGASAEAALPGAVAGAWWFLHGRGPGRLLGASATLGLALYAGLAPVLAGAAALGLGLFALLVRPGDAGSRRLLLGLAGTCLVAILAGSWARASLPDSSGAAAPTGGPAAQVKGLGVRSLVLRSSLDLLSDHLLLGVGPGQFAAAFPPYRDPREIELSTHGRSLPGLLTEVEHAHDDWLQGLLETGLAGGLAWLLFLALTSLRAGRMLFAGPAHDGALAAVALAVLAGALVRAPLTFDPASSGLAFAAFGALLARRTPVPAGTPAAWVPRLVLITSVAFLLVHVPRSVALVRHGGRLRDLAEGRVERREGLRAALSACDDSVLARSLHARALLDGQPAPGPDAAALALPAWRAVLELRPHRFEAWMQVGRLSAIAGLEREAREAIARARDLDPGHVGNLRNAVLLELEHGDADSVRTAIADLERAGGLRQGMLEAWGVARVQALDFETGLELLARSDPALEDLEPQRAYDLSRQWREADRELARALEGFAQTRWAREHAERGDAETALRSYRQARRALAVRDADGGPATVRPRLAMELAAAALLAGRPDEARRGLEGLDPSPRDLASLPGWAGDALLAEGWLGR